MEWTWKSFDGLEMFGRGWIPEGQPKAVITLVHGLGEHCGRYDHVGKMLVENGYALLAFDLRGHGKSGGQRGHAPSIEAFMKDIDEMLAQASARYPGVPQFIYGHTRQQGIRCQRQRRLRAETLGRPVPRTSQRTGEAGSLPLHAGLAGSALLILLTCR